MVDAAGCSGGGGVGRRRDGVRARRDRALLAAHAFGLDSADSESIGTPLLDNMLGLAALALLIPVTLGVARVVQRRPAGTLHSVAGRFRWPWFAVCLGLAFVTAFLVMAALVLLYDGAADVRVTIDPWRLIGIVVVLAVLVPLQAAGEEYATRGFLLQTFGAYHRWVGILGSALAFTLMHGIGTWSGFLALFVGATIWALLVIRTGGLEVSIAAHAAMNLLAFIATAASGGLDVADDTTAADAPIGATLIMLGGDITYAAGVLLVLRLVSHRRPRWARRTAPSASSPTPVTPSFATPPASPRTRDGFQGTLPVDPDGLEWPARRRPTDVEPDQRKRGRN
ncbi:CPBP family intramembrane glutamic endopeptidase [Micromonospora purpureochromogenes]|uniref:Membrane protease YdiL (CAAX protease family) n=1 Tax=Micromonospora purpureochromogenes TaxID=47872 RepID=A0ABX2RIF3_9ACTN|nr:CPBP family intramembrane glutamic endopeptidase [Micromonospora purpureochromogenes]NYF56285.1 membrane protease YdiL (CAAX protease family) [Micromonospora purpureochromogenes]